MAQLQQSRLTRAADDVSQSQQGMIAGTPLYRSPEQARGETLDVRSDPFSLGSVLYTFCTGRAAFAAGNTMAVLKRVCEATPRPIHELNPDIPEWLAEIVDRLLAKEPSERFQTAGALAEVLGQHLAQLQQSRLTPAPAPEKLAAVPPATAPAQPAGGTAAEAAVDRQQYRFLFRLWRHSAVVVGVAPRAAAPASGG